jgi:transmembrane sensor
MSLTQLETVEATAAEWLARRDAGSWGADDECCLQAWLDEATTHRIAWLRLNVAWERADQMHALPAAAAEGVSTTPSAQAWSNERRRSRSRKPWAAAAVVLAVLGLGWFGWSAVPGEERYTTAVGGLEAIVLADGSRVTLNTHTRARALVNRRERKVWLEEGEAFFEVRPDPALPFVVAAGGDRITVLGTKFSVRREGNRTQVTVLEGRVRLDRADSPGAKGKVIPTIASGNDSAVLQAGSVLVVAKTAEQVQHELSWRQGRLVFDQKTLAEIAAEFNRYNHKQVWVEGEAASLRLGGSFDAHNVEGFARLVHEGFGLNLRIDGNALRLSSN